MPRTAVVWFRRDLRLHDHPALVAALAGAQEVVPLFIADPVLLHGPRSCARRTDRLWAAVAALRAELRASGSGLVVREGDAPSIVADVAREVGATEVHVTADHTPYARRRDAAVDAALRQAGGRLVEHPGLLVHEVGSIATDAGRPYEIFGPFHRRWQATPRRRPLPTPDRIPSPAGVAAATGGDPSASPSGEADALQRLESFLPHVAGYGAERDRLDRDGTSRLSTALHLGTLSPIVLAERIGAPFGAGAERFLAEVAWRDFYAHRLAAEAADDVAADDPIALIGDPVALIDGPVAQIGDPVSRSHDPVAWRHDPVAFEAWATGRTGFPAVDAGMRQLAAEGWLPNRARMIAASFLVKDLLIDWRFGAAHFMRHLEDGDVASNTGNWRWVAGVGPGSAPWFRIFDPVAQGLRHDPDGAWLRRWLPELAPLSGAFAHRPWLATPAPIDYPARIVDHAAVRRRALDAAAAAASGRRR